jgi:SAM-dependent methyltransferase
MVTTTNRLGRVHTEPAETGCYEGRKMSDIETYYQEYYTKMGAAAYLGEGAAASSRMLQTVDWVRKHVKAGGKILDLGCGDAIYSELLPEYEWYGYDFNLEKASKRKTTLTQGSLEQLPYPYEAASMDAILCQEVKEHLFSPEKIDIEARRILKRNGVFIVSTPLHSWIMNFLQSFENLVYNKDLSWRREHIRTFTFESHKKMLNESGFVIDEFVGADGHYCGIMHPMALKIQERLREQGVNVSVYQIHQWMGQGLPSMQHTIMLRCSKA